LALQLPTPFGLLRLLDAASRIINDKTNTYMTQNTPKTRFRNFKQITEDVPLSARKIRGLIADGVIPVIRLPRSRRLLFDWVAVQDALRRYSTPTI
jgi:hypothetical protein